MKPKDFLNYPFSSIFQNSECETVALNIMKILSKNGNEFRRLTFAEYRMERTKEGNYTNGEIEYFGKVEKYCRTEATARFFSKEWDKKE